MNLSKYTNPHLGQIASEDSEPELDNSTVQKIAVQNSRLCIFAKCVRIDNAEGALAL